MLRAVLFDFYDTLAHVEAPTILAGRQALAARTGVDPDALAKLWRDTAHARMLGQLGPLEDEITALLARLDCPAPAPLAAELAALERQTWREAVTLYPDARPALEALKREGYRLGILSNCSEQAGLAIETVGLDDLLDTVALSFRLGVAKPDPAIYHAACAALAVTPAETIFVADGAFGELDAARDLAMVAVLIEQARQSRAYGASLAWDHRVTSLVEVPPLVARLAGR